MGEASRLPVECIEALPIAKWADAADSRERVKVAKGSALTTMMRRLTKQERRKTSKYSCSSRAAILSGNRFVPRVY